MATLAEIRAKLKASEQKGSGERTGGDNSIYPFWNLKEGDESVMRFLPDGNTDNTFFWVERAMIKLPFAGVKGESESKPVIVQVPCVEMYGDTCPILTEVRAWFKDPALEDMGRKYWKKRSYIFQGFVVEDGLAEKETPANPIRRFIIGPQIFTSIRAALVDQKIKRTEDAVTHARNCVGVCNSQHVGVRWQGQDAVGRCGGLGGVQCPCRGCGGGETAD